jgi:hypothetical protein
MLMIPSSFIATRTNLSWTDVSWGYDRGTLGWRDVTWLAQERVRNGPHDSLEADLARVNKDDTWRIREILNVLSEREHASQGHSKRKWLELTLAWVYENRAQFADPLEEVEKIYAGFDYPDEIVDFVRFMPPRDGFRLSGSPSENEKVLMDRWRTFVDRSSVMHRK